MAAMKRDGDRALPQQLFKAHQLPGFVRKDKRRHEVTWLRRGFSNSTLSQPPHQALYGIAERRPLGADGFRKGR
jgi:hypothetical protein